MFKLNADLYSYIISFVFGVETRASGMGIIAGVIGFGTRSKLRNVCGII